MQAISLHRLRPGATPEATTDWVAGESPLEIQLEWGPDGRRITQALSITMRTPGDDRALAAGFLLTEGIIAEPSDLLGVDETEENRVLCRLAPETPFTPASLERNFYTTSSCGVCGKSSLDAVRVQRRLPAETTPPTIDAAVLYPLPDRLRAAQTQFEKTGGIHASGLFDLSGRLLDLAEDVGRHNALDKLIGRALYRRELPLFGRILVLSGRASFELIQKASLAGISCVAAVGAPSDLAIQLAEEQGIALCGFVRNDRLNLYTHPQRIRA
jgi:FdhD protein